MLEWTENFDAQFLIAADRGARKAYEQRITACVTHRHTLQRLRKVLADPFYRPLMELERNSATDFASALVLNQRGFVEPRPMTARFGALMGTCIETVEISQAGFEYLHTFQNAMVGIGSEPPCDAGELIYHGVLAYLARDFGSGIVVTRDLAEVAIEIEDGDVLRRMMSVATFSRQISRAPADLPDAIALRRDAEDYWAPRSDGDRTGYEVIDLLAALPREEGG